jgi:propanol-preferring alcohol dehydrogenase
LVDLIDVKRGMNRPNQIGLSTIDRAQTCDLIIPIFKSNQKRVGIARRRGWTSKRLFDHASARVVLIEVKWPLALACNVCGTNAEVTPCSWRNDLRAMVLPAPGAPLQMQEREDPIPGEGQIRVKVSVCGVCRTDLHVADAELPDIKYPVVPGHEIVGRIDLIGRDVVTHRTGDRVGIPWLGYTCGVCRYCENGMENLCDRPLFTGYTRDGGFATHTIADARFAFSLGEDGDDVSVAPLLCAGLIGWRSLVMAGDARQLGIYGFGAAGHIVAQIARWQGRSVYAFTRSGDTAAQDFARRLGAVWAGASDELPEIPLDAAIIYAPAGELVPAALRAVRKGGRVVCAGIHMSDIPAFPYNLLWEERQLRSVANLSRQDGLDFLKIAPQAGIRTQTTVFPLSEANEVLAKLRAGQLLGAAVLQP